MKAVCIQITSGRGPLECCRVVAKVQELLLKDAGDYGVRISVVRQEKASLNGTFYSCVLLAEGEQVHAFSDSWRGVIQWIAQSPYRVMHKRKNWFVGVDVFDVQSTPVWNEKDVRVETCKASGPGGQHVNKTETAVRATHLPTKIQVLAMDGRSQQINKKLCLERLRAKVCAAQTVEIISRQHQQWQAHNDLERGQPKRVYKADLR